MLTRRSDKRVNKVVIQFPSYSLSSKPEVQRVVQKGLVVGPAVEDNRQYAVGVNAGAERRQGQLRHGDQNAPAPLVTDAENLLSIYLKSVGELGAPRGQRTGHHNVIDVIWCSPKG
jgi:hypothetical protein